RCGTSNHSLPLERSVLDDHPRTGDGGAGVRDGRTDIRWRSTLADAPGEMGQRAATMKSQSSHCLIIALLAPLVANVLHGQVVIQHFGASDPVTEGFYIGSSADVEVEPVFNDMGLDAWGIQKLHQGTYTYGYNLSLQQQEDAASFGWLLSGRMRLVEPGIGAIRFGGDFFLQLLLRENGSMLISQGNVNFYLAEAGHDYHEYSIVYDVIDEQAILWI